jgi:hypothetical protein
MNVTPQVTVKFNQFCYRYQGQFSLPEYKFLRQYWFGILRSGHVHTNKIASGLEEKITLKKTSERLSRNLGREGLWQELQSTHIRLHRRAFRRSRYWIWDLTDVSKEYAEKMEGLGRVYDGSKKEIRSGYWQMNVIGVNPRMNEIIPITSDLYSVDKEGREYSENNKILTMVDKLRKEVGEDKVLVMDRGGDRRVLLEGFLKKRQYFIIRQDGDRNLHEGEKKLRFQELVKTVRLRYGFRIKRKRGGRERERVFRCGARRVFLPYEHREGAFEEVLWLVVVREKGRAESWFLAYLPVTRATDAVQMAMEGYGYRWKIEEVHRQIKVDYHLESVSIRRYEALKNFNMLFWMMLTFLYQTLYDASYRIILASKEKLLYRNRFKELDGFIYYKLSKALRIIFRETTLMPIVRKKKTPQLSLVFTL